MAKTAKSGKGTIDMFGEIILPTVSEKEKTSKKTNPIFAAKNADKEVLKKLLENLEEIQKLLLSN